MKIRLVFWWLSVDGVVGVAWVVGLRIYCVF